MEWLTSLFTSTEGVAHTVLLLAAVVSVGLILGDVKIRGMSLGVTWILFAGIFAGHIGFTADASLLAFVLDFGLVLFLVGVGLQVGPGFFDNFGRGGVKLNLLAVCLVVLNVAVMFVCYYIFFEPSKYNMAMITGTLCGAATNTAAMGAANEALSAIAVHESGLRGVSIANGFACAFPLGVIGMILAVIAVRCMCRISMKKEGEDWERTMDSANPQETPFAMALRAENAAIAGRTIVELDEMVGREMVVTRMWHEGEYLVPQSTTIVEEGDDLHIVCAESDAEAIKAFIGPASERTFERARSHRMLLVSKNVVVSNAKMNGRTLGRIHFSSVYGVNISRIVRQGITLFASKGHHLKIGDVLTVVGEEANVRRVEELLGNSARRLDHPNLITIFTAVFIGIIFGQIPIMLPDMPVALTFGVAGGPLIIAILIGRFGHRLKLVTYTSTSANLMLRDIGLALFMACVGIQAGGDFVETIVEGDGLKYIVCGFFITVVPIVVVCPIAWKKMKINFCSITGLVAGAYTDSPALAFTNSFCGNEAPNLAYSTVYPLSMFLRILVAQVVILFACA